MMQQNVITDWKAEMARMQQHSNVQSALLQKTSKLQQALSIYALRTRRKEFYERLKVLMTNSYALFGKVPFDRVSEITHEQASLALNEVTAMENMPSKYTAADLEEVKTLIEEYRATLPQPRKQRKLTVKQQEKVNVALQSLETWRGYVPGEGEPAPPPVIPAPPIDWQAVWEKMRKHTEVKSALLKKMTNLSNALSAYAMKTGKKDFYNQLNLLGKHAWLLYKKGPFEKACEVVYEQTSLHLDAVTATENLWTRYTAADLQEFKTLMDDYHATAVQPLKKPTPKQQVKIDLAVKDLEGWRM